MPDRVQYLQFFIYSSSGSVDQVFELNLYYRNGKVTHSTPGR